MTYDFDKVVNRKNTNSIKHDLIHTMGYPEDIVHLWVADMDFPAPNEVIEAIDTIVKTGIFGYAKPSDTYKKAIQNWFTSRYSYEFEESAIIPTPGVVYSLAKIIETYTGVGETILIQTPVYYPFYEIIKGNNRKLVTNPLEFDYDHYKINFIDFEQKMIDHKVSMFILCSPHNPVGKVWNEEELTRLRDICQKHNVRIVSDEIHCDFVHDGYTFVSLGTLDKQAIIVTAPSKTFNLAGLQNANVIIQNEKERLKLINRCRADGLDLVNSLGLVACEAAYTYGETWLNELKIYLQDNINFVRSFIKTELPMVRLIEPEGLYLLWLDFSAYDLSQKELENRLLYDAKVWLDSGTKFGVEGFGFMRMNIACPRSVLELAMFRIKEEFTKKIDLIHLETFQHYMD